MRKLLLKVLLGMTFLLVGAVGMSKQVVADEVIPEEVTVVLDDTSLIPNDFMQVYPPSSHWWNSPINFTIIFDNPMSDWTEETLYFSSYFSSDFSYGMDNMVYEEKKGKVGQPFLLERTDSLTGEVVEAKRITIVDNRTFYEPLSEETLSISKLTGATAISKYGDVSLTITRIYNWVKPTDYVLSLDVNNKPFEVLLKGGIGDFLAKTPEGCRLIHLVLSDTPTSPTPPTLDIKEVTDKNFLSQVQLLFSDNSFKLFDISYLKDGVKGQPDGTVEVSLPIPVGFDKSKLAVYYVTDDGKTKEKITGKVLGDSYVFTTTHFSYYALVEEKTTISNTAQGQATETGGNLPTTDAGKTAVPVRHTGLGATFPILSGLILLVGSAFVSYRKQTANKNKI